MHNICWHHCLNHFSCNITLNIWSLEDWVVLVTSNCGSRTLLVRTIKVFFTFYAPVPDPQSPSFQHFQPHFSAPGCNFYVFSSLCREVFAPAANFQQLIALKVISPEHRSASRHYYLTQTKSALHHPSSIHQIVCLAFPLFECWVRLYRSLDAVAF